MPAAFDWHVPDAQVPEVEWQSCHVPCGHELPERHETT
jgi:hypothetical protein